MKNILPLLGIFLVACNSQPTTVPQKAIAQAIEEEPLTIDEVVAKFSNTPVKTDRTAHGLSDYRDTTYNNQEFTVKDTISYIGADNQGNEYLLLGRIDGTRTSAVKCYFENKADLEKLSVQQVVTIGSKKHFAIIKPVFPGTANPLTMTIVQMQKCNLLDAQAVHNFEVIRTDNRDPIINLDIYTTAKKENLKALNDDVCAIYNPGRDKFITIMYFNDKHVAAVWHDKVSDESVTEDEWKYKLQPHRLALYNFNPSNRFEKFSLDTW